jgi:hypothetical protein
MTDVVYCRRCGGSFDNAPFCAVCLRALADREIPRAIGPDSIVVPSGVLIDWLAQNNDPAMQELARHVTAGAEYQLSIYLAADLIRSLQPQPPAQKPP